MYNKDSKAEKMPFNLTKIIEDVDFSTWTAENWSPALAG